MSRLHFWRARSFTNRRVQVVEKFIARSVKCYLISFFFFGGIHTYAFVCVFTARIYCTQNNYFAVYDVFRRRLTSIEIERLSLSRDVKPDRRSFVARTRVFLRHPLAPHLRLHFRRIDRRCMHKNSIPPSRVVHIR